MASGRFYFITVMAVGLASMLQMTTAATCSEDLQNLVNSFPDGLIKITIKENTLEDTLLLNVTATDDLSPDDDFLFTIKNGSIYTKINISLDDNQTLCRQVSQLPLFTIKCQGDRDGKIILRFINYTDDYPPEIQSPILFNVAETFPVGFTVLNLADKHNDSDCESTQSQLWINETQTDIVRVNGSTLQLAQQLDYEQIQEYKFEINVASSIWSTSGSTDTYRQATGQLILSVQDVDDSDPVFDVTVFHLNITEEMNVPSNFLTTVPPLKARDGDTGINQTLFYEIVLASGQLNLTMDNETGQVQILSMVDREKTPFFTVIVKAGQTDKTYKTATATISIAVDDINDNLPEFTTSQIYNVSIAEDLMAGSRVVQLLATDDDVGNNAMFTYALKNDGQGAFSLREDSPTQQTWLFVADNGKLRGQTEVEVQVLLVPALPAANGMEDCDNITRCVANITVHIIDVNDNTPQFQLPRYLFNILSNHSSATPVGNVKATDLDRGDNARVEYSLSSVTNNGQCPANIESTTGDITLTQQFPAGTECLFIAHACDSPSDRTLQRCSSVPVAVAVGHGGSAIIMHASIQENLPANTIVTVLLVKGFTTNSTKFKVQNDILLTNTVLDREKEDTYQVLILTGTEIAIVINIEVLDVNDNPPVFQYDTYVVIINETTKIGDLLQKVTASDADKGNNTALTYSMLSGSEWFDLDSKSGEIHLSNFMSGNNTIFHLLVKDMGQPSLESRATLMVYSPVYNESAFVLLPVARDDLIKDRQAITQKLSSLIKVTVKILNIESLSPIVGSKVYIMASKSDGTEVSPTELFAILHQYADDIYAAFAQKQTNPASDDNGDDVFNTTVIILICVAAVLLLALLISFALLYRKSKKYRQRVRLFEKLNKDLTIYDSARKASVSSVQLLTNNGDSDDPRASGTVLKESNDYSKTNGVHSEANESDLHAFVNPGYQHNEESTYENIIEVNTEIRSDVVDSPATPEPGNLIDDEVNENGDLNTSEPEEKRVTRFGMTVIDEVKMVTSPVHMTTIDFKQYPVATTEDQSTPELERKNSIHSSEADSGIPNDNHTDNYEDDNDKEVASILKEEHRMPSGDQRYSDVPAEHNSEENLDLMTTKTNASPSVLYSTHDVENSDANIENIPDEPEPDYAKKVRFIEASDAVLGEEDNKHDRTNDFSAMQSEDGNIMEEIANPATDPTSFYFSEDEMTQF